MYIYKCTVIIQKSNMICLRSQVMCRHVDMQKRSYDSLDIDQQYIML